MNRYEDGRTTRILHGLMDEIEADHDPLSNSNKSLKFLKRYRKKYDFVDKFLTKKGK